MYDNSENEFISEANGVFIEIKFLPITFLEKECALVILRDISS